MKDKHHEIPGQKKKKECITCPPSTLNGNIKKHKLAPISCTKRKIQKSKAVCVKNNPK
jgi:hypothetical protein